MASVFFTLFFLLSRPIASTQATVVRTRHNARISQRTREHTLALAAHIRALAFYRADLREALHKLLCHRCLLLIILITLVLLQVGD